MKQWTLQGRRCQRCEGRAYVAVQQPDPEQPDVLFAVAVCLDRECGYQSITVDDRHPHNVGRATKVPKA